MDQYAKNFNRIAECVTRRTEFLGRKAVLADMVGQLSIRAAVFSRSTVNAEISSVRSVLRRAEMRRDGLWLGEEIHPQAWITSATKEDLIDAVVGINRSHGEILDDGDRIISMDLDLLGDEQMVMGRDEVIEVLAGRMRPHVERSSQKDQRYLTRRDLDRIEMSLADRGRIEAIRSLADPERNADIDGLLRIFINVIWQTGMRPREFWSSCLFVPRSELAFTARMRELVRTDPQAAVGSKLMTPVEVSAANHGEAHLGRAARNASLRSGAPCVLMIVNAKQRNANGAAYPIRMQVLENIPSDDLFSIAAATQLRLIKMDESRQDNIRSSMGRALARVVRRTQQIQDMKINLYTFRHSFVSRAKLAYEPHMAAALSGHTSRSTLYAYGQRNLRRGGRTARRMDDWLPQPDLIRAEEIRAFWLDREAPSPDATPEPVKAD